MTDSVRSTYLLRDFYPEFASEHDTVPFVELSQLRVAVLGTGQPAECWAGALGRDAAVSVVPDPLSDEVDGLIVAPGVKDPFARVREALLAGVPVLYAAPFLFSPWQAALLETVGRRRGSLLRIAEPFQYHGGFRFLQRLTRGQQSLWRLRYLRSTSLAPVAGDGRIDGLAVEDLAMCQALVELQPHSVTAAAAQHDEIGNVCAVFLTIHYPHGTVVQCTISLAELTSTRQLVAVTPNRTVVLDRLDGQAPLQIMAATESAAPPAKRSVSVPGGDPVVEEARRFLAAIRANDDSAANGKRWVRVAALWWAARQSISFGGAVEVPAPAVVLARTEPPPLRVIEGGGRVTRAAERPPLTLVAS